VRTNPYYGEILSKIYGFCDLVADLTALISFIGVGLVILFAVIKKISSSKRYIFFAISGIIVIAISTLFVIVNVTSSLVSAIIFQLENKNTPLNSYLIPSICEFIVALFFLGVCFIPAIIEKCKKNT
jgi:membrane protease YdiL (CAAX protease family)